MKPSIKYVLILSLTFFFLCPRGYAQGKNAVFPRIEPDPKALEFFNLSNRNQDYSWTELAVISLWASGNTSSSNFEKIRSAVEALNKSKELPASDREKAEFILTFMHKNLLKSYSLHQTRIDTLLSNGKFNCVSSAVMYMILCKSTGLNTSGVMTKDHAFITVHVGNTDIDIETTNQYGFDPGNRKEFHDSNGNVTGFAYVPPQNYRDRQKINQIELISLIMSNNIAELERSNKYSEAVPVAVDRAALLTGSTLAANGNTQTYPDGALFEDPRKGLLDRLINYGSTLLKAGKEDDALRWAAAASPSCPDKDRWQEFSMAAANNRIIKYNKAGQTTEAIVFLENQKALLSEEDYKQLDALLIDGELLFMAQKISTAEEGFAVVDFIDQAHSGGRIAEKRADELLIFAVQKTAALLSAAPAHNWRAAVNFMERSIERFGSKREFEQALQVYRNNLATEYHNNFASAWNNKNLDEAERILNEGLAEFPNDRQLLKDKDTVNKNRR